MGNKYNWLNLKHEFITGHWLTITDYFKTRNIPNNSRNRTNAAGWRQEKMAYQRRIIEETQEKSIESEVTIRIRQQQLALKLQSKGLRNIDNLPVKTVDEARKLIESGLESERQALGLNEHDKLQTQINITTSITKFDRMIEGMSYEDILMLIAQIKREQERRKLSQARESDGLVTDQ